MTPNALQALTARVAALEETVADLAETVAGLSARVDRACQIDDIMRRAQFGEATPVPQRPGHLRAVK